MSVHSGWAGLSTSVLMLMCWDTNKNRRLVMSE